MGGPGAGHEQPREKVTWTKRDLLLFANSIGCTVDELHFLYELHPKFAAFPTYPVILPFKKANIEVTDFYKQSSSPGDIPGVPKLDYRRVVDGERKIQFLKPFPVTSEGRNFELRATLIGAYDKGKATVLETEQLIVDKDTEEVYSRAVGSAFFVGQGGWGGPKGHETKSHPPPKGKSGIKVETKLTQEAAHLYRLNGDYNPLHATPEPGKAMGFGGPIMHGLCSWNMAAHVLLKTLGDSDPKNFKEFQARFASPVKPGSTLETEMWRMGDIDEDGFEEIRFTMKSDGKLCLSNGRAKIKCVEKGGKSKL